MPATTICPFCAVGCGLTVEKATPLPRFRGDPRHPVNRGALCARGAAATFETASRERLLAPLRRAPGGSRWMPVSWNEALDRTARVLLEARARTWDTTRAAATGVAFFGGATAMNEEVWLFVRLARLLGVLDLDHQGRACHAATTAGLRATLGPPAATHDWTHLLDARWILVLGSNPADAHPIAARYLQQARARGARVVVVDPRSSRTAHGADQHLAIRPGTDVALLCGLIAQALARNRIDEEWLTRHTDACRQVAGEAELDARSGRFGGWNETIRAYAEEVWTYRGEGRPDHPRSVLQALRRHFARYSPETVAAITAISPPDLQALADLVTDQRGTGAILFSMGVTQQVCGVAAVRAAAILQALLGNLDGPAGGLFPMKGHANIQGATDLGGLYTDLPGYLPAPTVKEPTLATYATRFGEAPATRLSPLLRAWMTDGEAGYSHLPRRRDGDRHSLHACLSRGATEVMVLLGQNPLHGSGSPHAVARALRGLRLLVCIDPFLTETSTFWERTLHCDTEVLALPSAMFAEKPGSRTNACRRVQWQEACLPPRGDPRPDAWIIHALYERMAAHLPHARWPFDGRSVNGLYRAVQAEMGEACWLYDGLPRRGLGACHTHADNADRGAPVQAIQRASAPHANDDSTEETGGEPDGWHWPGGHSRLRDGVQRRIRLWAGPCDIEGWREDAVPDGPLPEYYAPPGAGDNPLHPAQVSNPLLDVAPSDEFPLVLCTAMSERDARRCASPGAGVGVLEVRVPVAMAERLELTDGAPVWLETATRRAPAVLRTIETADGGVVWAPSHWSGASDAEGLHVVVDPGDRHTLLDDLRLVPCRLAPRG